MLSGLQARFSRNVLYRLKRDYGCPADLYHQTSETFDFTTGRQTPTTVKIHVKRAVLLPKTSARDDAHAVTDVGRRDHFSFGGQFAAIVRELLVDKRDLNDFDFKDLPNIYIIVGTHRYEITEITDLHGVFYYIKMKSTPGAQMAQIAEQTVRQDVDIDQDLGSTI